MLCFDRPSPSSAELCHKAYRAYTSYTMEACESTSPGSTLPRDPKMDVEHTGEATSLVSSYTRYAWQGLSITYHLLSIALVRIPLWILYFSVPSNRQNRRWTLRRAVIQRFIRHLMDISDECVRPLSQK